MIGGAISALGAIGVALIALEGRSAGQACCVGASGLTPGWLTNHERALVGVQLRSAETHGTYPTSGPFTTAFPGREARIETSLYGSLRFAPRGQVSVLVPWVVTRRRAGDVVESRAALGDVAAVARYDLVRAGESQIPGLAILTGVVAPTGTPSDRGTGLLAANVTGIGTWEVSAGASVEQGFGHVVLHATALAGWRAAREVLGVDQHLGLRAIWLVAGGWVFDDDVALYGTVSHASEGDATVAGVSAPGTGFRATQLALLIIAPLTDTLRLRVSAFTDVPPLGVNRAATGGTSISLAKSWL